MTQSYIDYEHNGAPKGRFGSGVTSPVGDGVQAPDPPISAYQEDMRDYSPDQPMVVHDNWLSRAIYKDEKRTKLNSTSLFNTILFIENLFANIFILNEFSDEIYLVRCPPWEDQKKFFARPYQQFDLIQMSAALEKVGITSDLRRTDSAIKVVAHKNSIHPVRTRFDKMEKWDGRPRLGTWLKDVTASSQDPAYLAKIGTAWLVAGVARIYKPGTKFDHMLIFEGVEGKRKSTAFMEMATFGEEKKIAYFSDSVALDKVTMPASIAKMQGRLIIEFADLDGMSKADDTTLKNFLTQTQDEVQKKYENAVTIYKRQCLFCGTTNENEYLKGTSGNRRYWPVKIKTIKLKKLIEIKEHLWAEAIHLYKGGYEIFVSDQDDIYKTFIDEQSQRMISDPWESTIEVEIGGKNFVHSEYLLGTVVSDISKRDSKGLRRITGILRKLGFRPHIIKLNNGKTERGWQKIGTEENVDVIQVTEPYQDEIPF